MTEATDWAGRTTTFDWTANSLELLGGNQGKTVKRQSYPRETKSEIL